MENQPSSISSPQSFAEYPPNTPHPAISPAELAVAHSAPPQEVAYIPLLPAHLNDPRRSVARKGFVMGLVSLLALFTYVISFFSFLLPIPFFNLLGGVTICGSLATTFVAPIFGIVFSIRGLKSTTRKGLAISGLILSIIPLIMLLAICSLAFMVAWSNDTTPY